MNIGCSKNNPSTRPALSLVEGLRACLGFTLLEIMVAIGILAVSLATLLTFHGNAMISSGRAERLTEATMLARQKMVELELEINKGLKLGEFPDDKEEDGVFEELYSDYKWKMSIKTVKLPAPIQGDEGSLEGMIGRQLTEEITKIVRELRLEVSWDEMGEKQILDVVTHIVKL